MVAQLMGHAVKGETFGRYGSPYLETLYRDAVSKLLFGFDLAHLKKAKFAGNQAVV